MTHTCFPPSPACFSVSTGRSGVSLTQRPRTVCESRPSLQQDADSPRLQLDGEGGRAAALCL